jgi:hypothetical protein
VLDAPSESFGIRVFLDAPRESFVGLTYANPPGAVKTCLNTKLAACRFIVEGVRHEPIR